jgi:hypothetical protein
MGVIRSQRDEKSAVHSFDNRPEQGNDTVAFAEAARGPEGDRAIHDALAGAISKDFETG